MCELLGMSFNQDVRANFSFRGFVKHSRQNPDGWGVAFYPDAGYAAQIIKEPIIANSSPMVNFLKGYRKLCSSVYISHIRQATSAVSYANTHPFRRELRGREFIFAHNGDLKNNYRTELLLGKWKPVGITDSEFAFCHLMDIIERKVSAWNPESFALIEESLKHINTYGNFNCLFSDGEYLFCYRDVSGYKGLRYTKRQAPFGNVQFIDEDIEINLSEDKRMTEFGYIIATNPLTNEE